VDVIVGAETGGIPLATAVALVSDLPFSFVRKPGYVGHETPEPKVRGASVSERRVLLVDDAVSSGRSVEAFVRELWAERATVVAIFSVLDMRDVAEFVSPIAAALPIRSVATYRDVILAAAEHGVLDPRVGELAIDALTNHWPENDPRWALLGFTG
jgi:orotate phosphoribosyltransferase